MSKERTGGVCFPSKGQTNCPSSKSNNSSSSNWGGNNSNYPTGGSHGGGGSYSGGGSHNEESKGDSYGESYGYGGYSHDNSHGYSTRKPWHKVKEAADRYEARKRQELEEIRLVQEINQQNELVRQQEDQKVKEIKETSEKLKAKNAPQAHELTPQYQEYQRKVAEAWADIHKRIALEKEVIHPKEDKIEFDKQKIRIDSTKKELDGLNSNQPKNNSSEVETYHPKITTILNQYKSDYDGFHKQVVSETIPIQALHTLSLRKTNLVDSRVVDLVFDLLKDNHLPSLKTLDLSGNPKSIGARQIDKLADSFYSENNKLETLDLSYAYTPRTDLRAKLPNKPILEERLFKELYSSGYHELLTLIHSVALCNQPLCITFETGVLIQSSNPPEITLYNTYMLFKDMNWMGEPESFKTTGIEMLNHIKQVFDRAYQIDEKEKLAPPQMYNIGVSYKLPHQIDTFTWGITKCLTPKAFSSEDFGKLKDKLSIPYVNMNKIYDVMQVTKTKIDTFVCVTEAMDGRIITHDMLNHQAEWKNAFPSDGYFNKSTSNKLGSYKITKESILNGKTNTQPFDYSCKQCEESQFAHFLNILSILEKNDVTAMTNLNLSNSDMDDCDASILAKLIRQGNLPNLKGLDVSGNHITATGQGYFAKAMQNSLVQDIMITIKKYVTTLEQQVIKPVLKEFLQDVHKLGIEISHFKTTQGSIEYLGKYLAGHLSKDGFLFTTSGAKMSEDMARLCKKGGEEVINFTWGISKCATGNPVPLIENIAKGKVGELVKDRVIEAIGNKTIQKIDIFMCVTEVIDKYPVSSDILDCIGSFSDLFDE